MADVATPLPSPDSCPALVLNADYRPLSYFPLSLWSWQSSVKAVFLDRVNILSEYDRTIRSPSFEMRLPSVISLREYIHPAKYPAFTRFNLFLRDKFACTYCGVDTDLTFDHVVPRSQGGRTTWENIVAACSACNIKKGGRTPREAKMFPAREPERPTMFELNERGRAFPPHYLHESWQDFLYWDSELEP